MPDKIIKGPCTENTIKMGLGEYLWHTAEKYGDRICQIDAYTHEKESFNTFRNRSVNVALELKKMGVQSKDIIMVICENNFDNPIPVMAAIFLGAIACSVEPFMEEYDVKYFITQVQPKVIFAMDKKLNVVEEAIKSLPYKPQVCVIGKSSVYPEMYEMEKTESKEDKAFKPVKVNVNDTALIVFSSGTTSEPKGVCLSHLSIMSPTCHSDSDKITVIDEPLLQTSSLYWVSGIWNVGYSIVFAQPRVVAANISALKFLELVDRYKIVHAFLHIHVLENLSYMDDNTLKNYDISSLKGLLMGGNYIDPKLILRLRKKYLGTSVVQIYSATEIGVPATQWIGCDKSAYENKVSSVGKPRWNVDIKVVDVETNEPLGANHQGEIYVKSRYGMNGFCVGEATKVYDKDGFLKTGDLGYYDEDGYLYIVDRLNDIFKYKGHKIAPSMIEIEIMKHPDVKEAVVFGLPHPSDFCHPAAFVVLKENAKTSAEDIYDFIKNSMSDLYLLRGGIRFLNSIPKSKIGKISRRNLKKLFLSTD